MKAVRLWHRLPRQVMDVPSLEVFKAQLDTACSNLGWKMSLPIAGGWNLIFNILSNPGHAIIL